MAAKDDKQRGATMDGSSHEAFDQPRDILDRDDLSYDEKLDMLQRWRTEIRNAETDGDDPKLVDVEQAIEQLQANVATDPSKPKQAPSGKGYRPRG